MQLIYQRKTKRCLPNYIGPTQKNKEYFKVTLFPLIEKIKQEEGLSQEQKSLIIIDNFKEQDNDQVRDLLQEINACCVWFYTI